ncbi:accessory gland protein Acp53Ea [Drosophila obscura]|uniref:accessory gland protein Acp53Ea n=1 Tax=Drosophila obscura TaxID=7282 RepID=UPI001BB2B8EC|nr:accessory gland protein Acp53Ea [Drosophila obscura]
MHLIKITLLLSLMALCHMSQVQALSANFEKYLNCFQAINEGASLLIENSIPSLKIMVLCIDYRPRLDRGLNSFLKYIRVVHEFAKKAIYNKPDCIVQMLSAAITLLKPTERKFNQLKCFDD